MTKRLEGRYRSPSPVPEANAILVPSGGIQGKVPPRQTVEIGEAGDRLLCGAHLYWQRKAPCIICTGNIATGGIALRPAAEDMAEFLVMLGISKEAIITEVNSENTHEHAVNLYSVLQARGCTRVLLVTSAIHMPRSMGVFKRLCPGIEFIPVPTDFRAVELGLPWYRQFFGLIPTTQNLSHFSMITHEYLGMAWYKLRGWM